MGGGFTWLPAGDDGTRVEPLKELLDLRCPRQLGEEHLDPSDGAFVKDLNGRDQEDQILRPRRSWSSGEDCPEEHVRDGDALLGEEDEAGDLVLAGEGAFAQEVGGDAGGEAEPSRAKAVEVCEGRLNRETTVGGAVDVIARGGRG